MSLHELAARVGTTRLTIAKLEKGDPSVGLGVLLRALAVLGLDGDLDKLATDDDLGQRLQDSALRRPRRPRRPASDNSSG
jgi:transcriptional regulator with XRE-family HTH domain